MARLQPAVKKETGRVAFFTYASVVVMIAAFGVLHAAMPGTIPFDYRVFLGGIGGGSIAVLNFFLMALMVQKAAAQEDQDMVKMMVRSSYTQRLALQIIWIIVAIVAPCFQFMAGILPLLFPSLGIKLRGILRIQMD